MFTGIIEAVGPVVDVRDVSAARQLIVDLGPLCEDLSLGDSISVCGVCLTAAEQRGTHVRFDVVRETLEKTSLGRLKRGDRVNLERALRVGDRFGGHIVQGHVDGTGTLRSLREEPGQSWLTISIPSSMRRSLLLKGSVAVDGISLTVADLTADSFSIAVVPHTLAHTNLEDRRPGDTVNLELDMVGRWVRQMVEEITGPLGEGGLDQEKLRRLGF